MAIFSFQIFGLTIAPTYYGLAYALGFLVVFSYLGKRKFLNEKQLDAFIMYAFFGVILGGRLGYVLFYNLSYYLENPLKILAVYEWGMSFHGAVIGVILSLVIFSRRHGVRLLKIADEGLFLLPVGLGLGRIANYLNNELFGYAPYSGPFAMIVDSIPHFPSPLLEAILEWPVLFFILWISKKFSAKNGIVSAAFLVGYGIVRMFAEFYRLPDEQIGYIFDHVSLGQLLSLPMVIAGVIIFITVRRK